MRRKGVSVGERDDWIVQCVNDQKWRRDVLKYEESWSTMEREQRRESGLTEIIAFVSNFVRSSFMR